MHQRYMFKCHNHLICKKKTSIHYYNELIISALNYYVVFLANDDFVRRPSYISEIHS